MPLTPDDMSGAEVFEHYARPHGDATRRVERTVLGHEVGLNGYTTLEQAQALSNVVGALPGQRLLDVGCGYGWPGVQIARRHPCDVVFSDVPLDALREAQAHVGGGAFRGRTDVVAADGRWLPFRAASFDAIAASFDGCRRQATSDAVTATPGAAPGPDRPEWLDARA